MMQSLAFWDYFKNKIWQPLLEKWDRMCRTSEFMLSAAKQKDKRIHKMICSLWNEVDATNAFLSGSKKGILLISTYMEVLLLLVKVEFRFKSIQWEWGQCMWNNIWRFGSPYQWMKSTCLTRQNRKQTYCISQRESAHTVNHLFYISPWSFPA